MTHLYGCCRWTKRYSSQGAQANWQAEMTSIANALEYTGQVSGFNAAVGSGTNLAHNDSMYIEMRVQGGNQVSFRYKRTSKVSGPVDGAILHSPTDDLREIDLDRAAMNAAGKRGEDYKEKYLLTERLRHGATPNVSLTTTSRGNKGDFHEVNPRKVVTFQVI